MVDKVRVTFRGIDPSTMEKLRQLAVISGCTMGDLVNSAVASWCPGFPNRHLADIAETECHEPGELLKRLANMIAQQDRSLNELYRLLGVPTPILAATTHQ